MKYLFRLRSLIGLICIIFVFTKGNAFSTEPIQVPPASSSNTQDPGQSYTVTARAGGIEVLSDTAGVDVCPYLQTIVKVVKKNWYDLTPPSARAPKTLRGDVSIEFAVHKTGKVAAMRLDSKSGDTSLDRAAWAAIVNSLFPALPSEYPGPYLNLRFHFVYSPIKPSAVILQYREGSQP
jgi:TonB family protein